MKTAILQMDIIWADPEGNVKRAEQAIDSCPGHDLYILPEMFSTGFCMEPEKVAEGVAGKTVSWMRQKAMSVGAAIAGSVATEEDGRFYNRFYFVKPDGFVVAYDKKHLFTYGNEHLHYTPGQERVVVEHKGVRILLEICYDLRFPTWARNHGDYDMIIYVASWPTPRVEAWKALLTARAIENQCYVAGVNRVGDDPSNTYCGSSRMIDPYGKIMAACEDGVESVAFADIDMDILEAFRQKFPVLNDAD